MTAISPIILFVLTIGIYTATNSYKILSTSAAYNSEFFLSNGEYVIFDNQTGIFSINLQTETTNAIFPSETCPAGGDGLMINSIKEYFCVSQGTTAGPNFELAKINPFNNNEILNTYNFQNLQLQEYPVNNDYITLTPYGNSEGALTVFSLLSGKIVCQVEQYETTAQFVPTEYLFISLTNYEGGVNATVFNCENQEITPSFGVMPYNPLTNAFTLNESVLIINVHFFTMVQCYTAFPLSNTEIGPPGQIQCFPDFQNLQGFPEVTALNESYYFVQYADSNFTVYAMGYFEENLTIHQTEEYVCDYDLGIAQIDQSPGIINSYQQNGELIISFSTNNLSILDVQTPNQANFELNNGSKIYFADKGFYLQAESHYNYHSGKGAVSFYQDYGEWVAYGYDWSNTSDVHCQLLVLNASNSKFSKFPQVKCVGQIDTYLPVMELADVQFIPPIYFNYIVYTLLQVNIIINNTLQSFPLVSVLPEATFVDYNSEEVYIVGIYLTSQLQLITFNFEGKKISSQTLDPNLLSFHFTVVKLDYQNFLCARNTESGFNITVYNARNGESLQTTIINPSNIGTSTNFLIPLGYNSEGSPLVQAFIFEGIQGNACISNSEGQITCVPGTSGAIFAWAINETTFAVNAKNEGFVGQYVTIELTNIEGNIKYVRHEEEIHRKNHIDIIE